MHLTPEEKIQISVVQYLSLCFPQCVVFMIKNDNKAHKAAQGRKISVMKGLLPGIHDICVLAPKALAKQDDDGVCWWPLQHVTWEAHFIECKTESGKLSKSQLERHREFDILCIKHATCRSVDDVALAMRSWGIPSQNKLDQI